MVARPTADIYDMAFPCKDPGISIVTMELLWLDSSETVDDAADEEDGLEAKVGDEDEMDEEWVVGGIEREEEEEEEEVNKGDVDESLTGGEGERPGEAKL